MTTEKNKKLNCAVLLTVICSVSYLAVYVSRTMLSAVTPQLVESGNATNEYVGAISSAFFICYALGQLVNGILGEKLGGKYMVTIGLMFSGLVNTLFLIFILDKMLATVLYGMLGFGLSMVYAPMVKVIAENMELIYAEKSNLGLQVAALLGSPVAGLVAGVFAWKTSLATSSVMLCTMGIVYFVVLTNLEKKKLIKTTSIKSGNGKKKTQNENINFKDGIKVLIKRGIIPFTIISGLTGIVRTSVTFWLPTYISQHLNFSVKQSAFIYTVATLIISLSSFITMFVYNLLHRDIKLVICVNFGVSALMFLMTHFVTVSYLNIALFILALISANVVSSMIWIVYCPGLHDTGMVSTATGYLDFVSYMAAALANIIFTNAVSSIGWGNLILVWSMLMAVGIATGLSKRIKKQKY